MKITNATQYSTQDLENLVTLCWANRRNQRTVQQPQEIIFIYANSASAVGMLGSSRRLKLSSLFLVRLRQPYKLNIPELEQLSMASKSASVPESAILPLAAVITAYFSYGWIYSVKRAISDWMTNNPFALPDIGVETKLPKGAAKLSANGVARSRLLDLQIDEAYTQKKLDEWVYRLNVVKAKKAKLEVKCRG